MRATYRVVVWCSLEIMNRMYLLWSDASTPGGTVRAELFCALAKPSKTEVNITVKDSILVGY